MQFLEVKITFLKNPVILMKITPGILMGLGGLLEVNVNPVPTKTFM